MVSSGAWQCPAAETISELHWHLALRRRHRAAALPPHQLTPKECLPELGTLRLDEVTSDRIKQFVATLVQKKTRIRKVEEIRHESGDVVERKITFIERPLSRSSIRIIIAALRLVFLRCGADAASSRFRYLFRFWSGGLPLCLVRQLKTASSFFSSAKRRNADGIGTQRRPRAR